MAQTITNMLQVLSMDFYAGWSAMDFFRLAIVLYTITVVLQYIRDKAE